MLGVTLSNIDLNDVYTMINKMCYTKPTVVHIVTSMGFKPSTGRLPRHSCCLYPHHGFIQVTPHESLRLLFVWDDSCLHRIRQRSKPRTSTEFIFSCGSAAHKSIHSSMDYGNGLTTQRQFPIAIHFCSSTSEPPLYQINDRLALPALAASNWRHSPEHERMAIATWLGMQGSNLRCGSQSAVPYRLANPQCGWFPNLMYILYYIF